MASPGVHKSNPMEEMNRFRKANRIAAAVRAAHGLHRIPNDDTIREYATALGLHEPSAVTCEMVRAICRGVESFVIDDIDAAAETVLTAHRARLAAGQENTA